jgi:predicted flap endonuclease-1-like 5' DNA nuclease
MAETVPDTASEVKAEDVEAVTDVAEKASDVGAAAVDKILEFLGLSDPDDLKKFHQGLEYVEGIGPVYAEKLRGAGVVTLLDLLERGATSMGRDELAEESGIGGSQILKWVNHVDLYRVKGVGSEYADLLEASGVDTVVELAQRNPVNLAEKIVAVNEEKNLVRRTPVQSQVEEWVDQAKNLPRVISY